MDCQQWQTLVFLGECPIVKDIILCGLTDVTEAGRLFLVMATTPVIVPLEEQLLQKHPLPIKYIVLFSILYMHTCPGERLLSVESSDLSP